jgi:dihydrofolate reductase
MGKVVVSQFISLDGVVEDIASAVADLKQNVDGNILVDEYRLMVYPTVLGAGKHLFGETSDAAALLLVDAKPAGETLILIYEPRARDADNA